MATDGMNMKSDKILDADINKATSFADLQALLHNAVERSPEVGFTRDEVTGRFVPREPVTPNEQAAAKAAADKAAADAPREFKQTVQIAGTSFSFVASSVEALQAQIDSAQRVAQSLTAEAVTPRSVRHAESRTPEQIAMAKSDAEIEFRQGKLSTTEFLERTGAFDEYLAAQGVDVAKIALDQATDSWEAASEVFRNSPAGASWPGGIKNRALLGDKLAALGLTGATTVEDKVAALSQAYEALKAAGTIFDGDHTPEEMNALAAKMSPAEILEHWKASQHNLTGGDIGKSDELFIESFRNGRSSGLFGT